MGTKHIPQRTCIACRTTRGKRELIRIVRISDNHVEADATGKKAGRGGYLCRQRECWEEILAAPNRLKQALKIQAPIQSQRDLQSEDMERLREFAATLPPRVSLPAVKSNESP